MIRPIARRTFIKGASMLALAASTSRMYVRDSFAQQVPNSTGAEPAKLKAPPGACDCHHHIYDAVRFPPATPGGRIIPDARVEEFRLLQRRIGTSRNIVVTPSAYVTDNRVTLGLHAFFRAYYHYKSADWKGNKPHPLKARTAAEMAQIPTYYVMERDKGMAETVAPFMPSAAEIAACKWLTEVEVDVYASEYARTQFTGALQGYRVRRGSDPKSLAEMRTFSGRSIDVPSMFVGGKSDWGVYQTPGAVDRMRTSACTRMVGFHLLEGAGHWVQQEQPEQVSRLLMEFLRSERSSG